MNIFRCSAAIAVLLMASVANAAVIITAVETGGDVVFSTSGGSLNLNGLTFFANVLGNARINPTDSILVIGPTVNPGFDAYSVVTALPSFGSGSQTVASSGVGGPIGIGDGGLLYLPDGYVSQSLLPAISSTYSGENFATLGMTPGTYVWTLPADSITLNIVPIPAAAWLFGSALGLLGWIKRRNTH